MALEGYTDFADSNEIRGWVFDPDRPDEGLSVEILLAEKIIASVCADQFRADLLSIRKGNGKHGFSFSYAANQSVLPLVARVGDWLIPLGSFLSASRYQGKFSHPLERGLPVVETKFSRSAGAVDSRIVERLIVAYHRAVADQPRVDSARQDMWTAQMDAGHREFDQLLGARDVSGVGAYLAEAHARSLTNGITQGNVVTGILRARADARQRVAAPFVDYLVSLAEFLGILNVECSDQNSGWGENLHRNPRELIDRISGVLGFDIIPPQVIGAQFGIGTERGVLTGRDLMSLHTAIRLGQVMESPSVCEIGGGLGGVAYYANQLGIQRYTIIDLPIVNVLQGYYLSSALPDAQIQLYGEASAGISIFPTHCFDDESVQFDVLLNQDSMPEIHPDFSIGYLRAAGKKKTHFFLSVNQEAQAMQTQNSVQSVVGDLVKRAGGYLKVSRNRHWIRAGYVEEVYRSV